MEQEQWVGGTGKHLRRNGGVYKTTYTIDHSTHSVKLMPYTIGPLSVAEINAQARNTYKSVYKATMGLAKCRVKNTSYSLDTTSMPWV